MGCDGDHPCMTTGDNGLPGQFLPESSCPDEVSSRILDASALDVSGRWRMHVPSSVLCDEGFLGGGRGFSSIDIMKDCMY